MIELNVLGTPLKSCCFKLQTGFYRDGYCRTGIEDVGRHTICAIMTKEFLEFSLFKGNDLITPRAEMDFPGLKPGDKWCLCALRWKEAFEFNAAPLIFLEACHESVLNLIPLDILKTHAYTLRH